MARFSFLSSPFLPFFKKCVFRILSAMKLVLPASDHPAAAQSTPYNLNRFNLLLIYMFYVAVSAYIYLGWGSFSAMLFRHQIFIWQCNSEDRALAVAAAAGNAVVAPASAASADHPLCLSQDLSVQNLFTCAFATHFCISALAGVLTDTAGPKVTALLGQTMNICGWFMLGGSSNTFRVALPAFILIGAASGMSYLPMLCIIHLFPGGTGFGLTMMGAACSLGLAVPVLMNRINLAGLSFKGVLWLYTLFGPGLCFVIVCLFVPLNGFIEVDRFVLIKQNTDNDNVNNSCPSPPAAVDADADADHDEASVSALPFEPSAPLGASLGAPRGGHGGHHNLLESEGEALSSVTDETFFQPFKKEACTFLYVGLCTYFAISSVVMNYFQKSAFLFLSDEAYNALNIALPLSVIPCLVLGRL